MGYNSAALDAFVKFLKVMNLTELCDAEFAKYFPNTTSWICLYGLECALRIQSFR